MNNERGYGLSLLLSGNQTAIGLMLGYVALLSFMPLAVAYGAVDSPFIFNAAYAAGMSIGCALILLIFFREEVFSGEVWKVVWSRAFSLAMLFWVVNFSWIVMYAWSTHFIDVAIATALYETWPIFVVAFTGKLLRRENRYRKITVKTYYPFGIAFLGIGSVIASQSGGIGAFFAADTGGGKSCDRRHARCYFRWPIDSIRIRIQMVSRPRLGIVQQP